MLHRICSQYKYEWSDHLLEDHHTALQLCESLYHSLHAQYTRSGQGCPVPGLELLPPDCNTTPTIQPATQVTRVVQQLQVTAALMETLHWKSCFLRKCALCGIACQPARQTNGQAPCAADMGCLGVGTGTAATDTDKRHTSPGTSPAKSAGTSPRFESPILQRGRNSSSMAPRQHSPLRPGSTEARTPSPNFTGPATRTPGSTVGRAAGSTAASGRMPSGRTHSPARILGGCGSKSPAKPSVGMWGEPVEWRSHLRRSHLHELLQVGGGMLSCTACDFFVSAS